jgi:hypothetical protein
LQSELDPRFDQLAPAHIGFELTERINISLLGEIGHLELTPQKVAEV